MTFSGVVHGDCIEVMNGMDPESIDAVVTDPPYGIGFMGKAWDSLSDDPVEASWNTRGRNTTSMRDPDAATPGGRMATGTTYAPPNPRCGKCGRTINGRDTAKGFKVCHCENPTYAPTPNRSAQRSQEWHQQWAEAAYRVAKPSAYLLAFGGTRTVHRMTCALEDAGWIIRDMLVWGYASGFPKSKASLKPAWEPIVMARKPGPLRMLAIDECRIPTTDVIEVVHAGRKGPANGGKYGNSADYDSTVSPLGRWPANIVLTDAIFEGGIEGVVGGGEAGGWYANDTTLAGRATASGFQAGDGSERIGYGDTGTYSRFFLIPKAARSDREPVLGGLAVQHAGVGIRAAEPGEYLDFVHPAPDGIGAWLREQREGAGLRQKDVAALFPSKTGGLTGCVANWELELNRPTPEQWTTMRDLIGFDDRYDEVMTTTREVPRTLMDGALPARRANHHPTVKPVDLMRHLVRLVTPTGGTVLDPFLGSGTTAIAAEMEGFEWIGIEREAEYVAIAEARLNGTQRGLGLGA